MITIKVRFRIKDEINGYVLYARSTTTPPFSLIMGDSMFGNVIRTYSGEAAKRFNTPAEAQRYMDKLEREASSRTLPVTFDIWEELGVFILEIRLSPQATAYTENISLTSDVARFFQDNYDNLVRERYATRHEVTQRLLQLKVKTTVKETLPMLYGYRVAEGAYPQIWTDKLLPSGDLYTCERKGKRPYSFMVTTYREVFPIDQISAMNKLEKVSLSSTGFSLTSDFSVRQGWMIPTWEADMAVIQILVMKAYKDKRLSEDYARSRYNRLTKIVNLGLHAGSPGEKQGAIGAANRVITSIKENLQ